MGVFVSSFPKCVRCWWNYFLESAKKGQREKAVHFVLLRIFQDFFYITVRVKKHLSELKKQKWLIDCADKRVGYRNLMVFERIKNDEQKERFHTG